MGIGDTNKTRYRRKLIQLFALVDEEMSHHDVLKFTDTWKHGLTSSELGNILSKDGAFEETGTVLSGGRVGKASNWRVNTYVLSPTGLDEADGLADARWCVGCSTTVLFGVHQGRTANDYCRSCYLLKMKEKRRKK